MERAEILKKEIPCDSLLLTDIGNITYLTGVDFPLGYGTPSSPMALVFPPTGGGTLVCPFELTGAVRDQNPELHLLTYTGPSRAPGETVADTIAAVLRETGTEKATVGIDEHSMSLGLLLSLKKRIPGAQWLDGGSALSRLRAVKDPEEKDMLSLASEQLETGIVGALQHLEGSLSDTGYTAAEFCERIRVHVYENGGTAGGLATAPAGTGRTDWYALPRDKFRAGELVRIEATSKYRGYWASSARMMVLGAASELQSRYYRENLRLKDLALLLLRPGAVSGEIFSAVKEEARKQAIPLRPEFGIGFGTGTSEREEPFLVGGGGTVLAEGMCVVLSVYTEGPEKELICSKDTYFIGSDDSICISRYRGNDDLYVVDGFRSAH